MNHQDHQAVLSKLMQADEEKRKEAAKNHQMPCVPWRGAGGEIGRCVYCGEINSMTHKKGASK